MSEWKQVETRGDEEEAWEFGERMGEGMGRFPPRVDRKGVTWYAMRQGPDSRTRVSVHRRTPFWIMPVPYVTKEQAQYSALLDAPARIGVPDS